MDYVESFRLRFRLIDKQNPRPLAIKKKKDIRRMVITDGPDDKRASLDIVWAEEREAGRV
jgi:hypothetical protein